MKTTITKKIPLTPFTKGGVILIFLACAMISTAAVYDYLYVNSANPTPTPPYDTWEKAATDIQTAVDAASKYDHVIVTNGVYSIGETITPGHALSNRVVITKNITVRSVNGPENTIILGAEAPGGGNSNGAVRCVFMTAGKLYGFTISNGFTHDIGWIRYDSSGGGIWMTNGCIVTNCVISGNSSGPGGGRGVYCYHGGSISDCTISGNKTDNVSGGRGGGVRCYFGGSVSDCIISGNSAYWGGGTYLSLDGVVSNCIINGNSADNGGGVYCYSSGSVSKCTISGNSSLGNGGGAYCYIDGSVSDCTISGNSAGYYGGGVYCYKGGSFSDCTISGNSAVYGGGGYCSSGGALTNCLIYNMNTATFGGGVYLKNDGALYNCTIAGNNASDYGGGICTSNGGTIVNTIIYDNQAFSGNINWLNYESGAIFNYCCTTPTNGLPSGNQCTPDDPLFVAPGSDYRLQEGSPCIDTGYYMTWMDPPVTDLDGNPRIHDGKVDIGCYEFIPEPGFYLLFIIYQLLFINYWRKLIPIKQ